MRTPAHHDQAMSNATLRRILRRDAPLAADAGSATVMALLALSGLMLLSVAFFQLGSRDQARVLSTYDDERALHLAESGLNEALIALRAGATGNVGLPAQPAALGGGVFWSEASDTAGGLTRVKVTALIGEGRRAVEAIVDATPGEPPLFETVLNSDEAMTLNQGVVIDSFDSTLGDYASQQVNNSNGFDYAGDNGDVASNQDIFLNNSSTVFGDATPGPGHIVDDAATGAYVSGSKQPSDTAFTFPPIEVPTGTTSAGDATYSGVGNVLAAGTYEFDAFSVSANSELTVEGPAVVIVDDFTGGKAGSLLVDATAGPVTFFVRGGYSHIKSFEVDAVAGSPNAIAFMIEGPNDIVFPSATAIRGAYYAPEANILFSNGNECWGAFAANRIDMSNDMRFHYDEALLDHWTTDGDADGDEPRSILAWSDADVDQQYLADRRDPIVALGLQRANLLAPVDSWDLVDGNADGEGEGDGSTTGGTGQ